MRQGQRVRRGTHVMKNEKIRRDIDREREEKLS